MSLLVCFVVDDIWKMMFVSMCKERGGRDLYAQNGRRSICSSRILVSRAMSRFAMLVVSDTLSAYALDGFQHEFYTQGRNARPNLGHRNMASAVATFMLVHVALYSPRVAQ